MPSNPKIDRMISDIAVHVDTQRDVCAGNGIFAFWNELFGWISIELDI